MTEIEKFYNSFNQEVATLQLSEENGESQEQEENDKLEDGRK